MIYGADVETIGVTLASVLGAVVVAYLTYRSNVLGLQKATSAGRAKASASEARAAAADAQATALAFAPLIVDMQAQIKRAEQKADLAVQEARERRNAEERCLKELDRMGNEHNRLEKMLEGVLDERAKRRSRG